MGEVRYCARPDHPGHSEICKGLPEHPEEERISEWSSQHEDRFAFDQPVSLKIQDYAIIGNCRAAALIGRDGSLDWLCWPRFDSPAIFARLLDAESGGSWAIAPIDSSATGRRYIKDTNVLETRFRAKAGTAVLTDLMPVFSDEYKHRTLVADHEILRQIECTEGEVSVSMRFEPRANYGAGEVRIRDAGLLGFRFELGKGVHWLRSSHPLTLSDGCVLASVKLRVGEAMQYSLTYTEDAPAVLCSIGEGAKERIRISQAWWERWAGRATYDGPYREAVVRSALSLKLLTYAPSGAIVAAATTSLPERVGADLNWDYRYCWLRDASLTTRALVGLGYREEADAFLAWMLHATRLTQPELRIVYTAFGEQAPEERELPYLNGYFGSRPVRVGNDARNQVQLDVYGEVIDAAAQCASYEDSFDRATQKVLIEIGKYVLSHWRQPDHGIWESRGAKQHHTHSRLLCWTALDRLCKLASRGLLEKCSPLDQFAELRQEIQNEILARAWNDKLHSYASVLGGCDLDASLLLLAWYGFERADSARMRSTYDAIAQELRAGADLLFRQKTEAPEGAFGICSFWEAEYLALGGGSLQRAQSSFERLLRYGNDLGLYSEEIDPSTGDALGNFPQAFTHVGLINAALSILERQKGMGRFAIGSQKSTKSELSE